MATKPTKPARDERGRLLPGGTANPGGRPAIPEWLRGHTDKLLRLQLRAAVEGVVPTKIGGKVVLEPVEAKDRLAAAEKLLDRLLGRAVQTVAGDGVANDFLASLAAQFKPKEPPK